MTQSIAPKVWEVGDAYFDHDAIAGAEPYGCGHIQDTYRLVVQHPSGEPSRYILQRLNRNVFPDPVAMMENICAVTDFMREKLQTGLYADAGKALTVVPTRLGASYYMDSTGEYWRIYDYVEETITYQLPDSEAIFGEAARTFGAFQMLLADFPAHRLHEIIPHFHDTPARAAQLEAAIAGSAADRAQAAKEEIAFARERYEAAGQLMSLQREGALPLRVTHNDTKLNNVLFHEKTGKGLCVVDLDTVMPGLVASDFGDAIRFGANTALENEQDLSKVSLSLPLFEAYTKGYLEKAGAMLRPLEIETLALGALTITLEIGMRFLADYLNGDVYFKIHYPEENLTRARNQFALVRDMEKKRGEMESIVTRYGRRYAQ